MASITVWMKDGKKHLFPHKGRSGGSWTNTVRYEGGMAIVKDEWGNETAFPVADIERVESEPNRY